MTSRDTAASPGWSGVRISSAASWTLLVEKQGNVAEFLRILLIDGPDVLLGDVRGDDLLHVADADALLHGQDHDEIGDVDPEVFPLYRGGHDLQPHIVVDGGGGDKAFLPAGYGRDEVQILGQQHHHLVHIQPQIGDGVPLRQVVVGDEPGPTGPACGRSALCHIAYSIPPAFPFSI